MTNGQMGVKLHKKIVTRIRALLRKDDDTIPMIAERLGVSTSQIRNIKGNRKAAYLAKQRSPEQEEVDALFDEPITLEPRPEPKPKRVSAPKNDINPFDELEKPARTKLRSLTPDLERKIIKDLHQRIVTEFRGNMPFPMIAKKHRVTLETVELLNARVYWQAELEDPNILWPCLLTEREYLESVGPRFSAKQMEMLKPYIESVDAVIVDVLNVDLPTATIIRKVMMLHHLKSGRRLPPQLECKPEPLPDLGSNEQKIEAIISELFAEMVEPSDDLERVVNLTLRFFGREPEAHTVDAWINGKNDSGIKLPTFEVDGQLMTTEKHFREFFGCFCE